MKPGAGAPWTSAQIATLAGDLDGMLAGAPALRGAHAGLLVLDSATGTPLYARLADDAFQPASTLKLVVGSVALATLGPAARLTTSLTWAPPVLTVHAGGDAQLTLADLAAAASAAAAAGVRDVGRIEVDATRYDDLTVAPGWTADDAPYDYAAPVSAAALEENVVHLHVSAGLQAGLPAAVTLEPAIAPVRVRIAARTVAWNAPDPSLDLARDGETLVVTGTIAAGSLPQTLDAAVPEPRAYLAAALRAALVRAGVRVRDDRTLATIGPAAVPVTVWTHAGEPLGALLADLWLPSDNLIAELLLRELGANAGARPATAAAGLAVEAPWLAAAGVDPSTTALVDGSGLSAYDRLTPRAEAAVLQADWNGPLRDVVLDALPVAGVRGTLRDAFAGTAAAGRVFAKTGTLRHASALAGYLRPRCHGAVTFASLVDDWLGEAADLRDLRGRVLTRIIESGC